MAHYWLRRHSGLLALPVVESFLLLKFLVLFKTCYEIEVWLFDNYRLRSFRHQLWANKSALDCSFGPYFLQTINILDTSKRRRRQRSAGYRCRSISMFLGLIFAMLIILVCVACSCYEGEKGLFFWHCYAIFLVAPPITFSYHVGVFIPLSFRYAVLEFTPILHALCWNLCQPELFFDLLLVHIDLARQASPILLSIGGACLTISGTSAKKLA